MSFYLDASFAVAALTNETGSPAAIAWLERRVDDTLITSPWLDLEVSSALSIKERQGQMTPGEHARALGVYMALRRSSERVQVQQHHFSQAARLCDEVALRLRAGDALHLAVCIEAGAALCTLDEAQALAAQAKGVRVERP